MHAGGFGLLFAVGLLAGVVNVVAGGGSFLTLPALIFLGIPPGVANATNRVGILLQNVAAVWSFDRARVLERRALLWAAAPAVLGAAGGAWLALLVPDAAFQRLLAVLMVLLTLWSLRPRRPQEEGTGDRRRSPLATAGFLLVGLYGGFVQAGVGFLTLAVTTFAGLDLVRGNAVKVLTALCFTIPALALFAFEGRVDWPAGLALGIGFLLGGLAGARLTVLKGHRWLRGVVALTVILFAAKLLLGSR